MGVPGCRPALCGLTRFDEKRHRAMCSCLTTDTHCREGEDKR